MKNAVETYELTIDELQITRVQRECPTMVILRNEVQRIAERTGQGFRIESSDSGKNIWVPKQLEGYEEVKTLLLSTTPAQASTMRYPLAITYGASLLVIAGFFIVMWSKQRMLVTTAGIVVLCLCMVSWHRAGFRRYWRWRSRREVSCGRRRISRELRELIFQMAAENPTWGAPRIHGELLKLGFDLSERTVSRWVRRAPKKPDASRRWKTFLSNHREAIAAMDFFTVPTITFSVGRCLRRLKTESC